MRIEILTYLLCSEIDNRYIIKTEIIRINASTFGTSGKVFVFLFSTITNISTSNSNCDRSSGRTRCSD